MKTKLMLSILIVGLILAGCGGDSSKTKSQSSSKSSVSSSSYKQMLQQYGDILDDYADVMKKVGAGDMSAMQEMLSHTEKITKWMEKWETEMSTAKNDLSAGDLADIMKEYQKLSNKYLKIASNM
jgi:outer membrane PBP1 activator LpoA protein|tara:strand:+ start:64 stop:438 length:375 start_codon:yes stop_codon:yes gene_type:complete